MAPHCGAISACLCEVALRLRHVASLELAILASRHVELHSLAFIEGLEAVHLDLREVDEEVFAIVLRDEPIAFLGVEPLHGTFCHFKSSFLSLTLQGGNTACCMAAALALTSRAREYYTLSREKKARDSRFSPFFTVS